MISFFVGRITINQNNVLSNETTTIFATTIINGSVTNVTSNIPAGKENNTLTKTLYANETVNVPPPQRNYDGFNYVTGCYWIDGYYNFSFYAPYGGYIVFNETNTGIPNNFTESYFSVYISTEKPRYDVVSTYNESYWCTGETVQSNVAPYTRLDPYNNQTMLIPVRNGTNYVIFYNGNANEKHGINPFPINVTFSMKYYGFIGANYVSIPGWNFNVSPIIQWGRYQSGN